MSWRQPGRWEIGVVCRGGRVPGGRRGDIGGRERGGGRWGDWRGRVGRIDVGMVG